MNDKKLSSDEVPGKFMEWLLDMGCPPEKVPSLERMTEICRGHYMVWRSLIEQVDARDQVHSKRLQVFCDDVKTCQEKNVFQEGNANTVVPEELLLWQKQSEMRRKVAEAKTRVALVRQGHEQQNEMTSHKMSQCSLARQSSKHAARRAWLLKEVATELTTRTDNLRETRDIAHSLLAEHEDDDLQNKLDKCLASIRRQISLTTDKGLSSSTASVTSNSGDNDFESLVESARRSRGAALCRDLLARRAALLTTLTSHQPTLTRHRISPQSVLAHTAALHCSLALEATKNKIHANQASNKLLANITELNNYLSGEACELLVLRCERADVEARVGALKALLEDLTAGTGPFRVAPEHGAPATRQTVAALDKAIESKRMDLLRMISSVCGTQHKCTAAADRLTSALTLLHTYLNTHTHATHAYSHGNQLDISQLSPETISEMRDFYENQRERHKHKMNISLDIDASDSSGLESIDYNNPRLVDELRIYLNKFSLEKNRQLVLESGKKLWVFETVASSYTRLLSRWIQGEAPLLPLPPLRSPSALLASLVHKVKHEHKLLATLEALAEGDVIKDIDISSQAEEENVITDRVKKRLSETLQELQKVNKALSLAEDNLRLWADNKTRKYITPSKHVEGLSYAEYENLYLEYCMNL